MNDYSTSSGILILKYQICDRVSLNNEQNNRVFPCLVLSECTLLKCNPSDLRRAPFYCETTDANFLCSLLAQWLGCSVWNMQPPPHFKYTASELCSTSAFILSLRAIREYSRSPQLCPLVSSHPLHTPQTTISSPFATPYVDNVSPPMHFTYCNHLHELGLKLGMLNSSVCPRCIELLYLAVNICCLAADSIEII